MPRPDRPFEVYFGDAPDYLMRKVNDDHTAFINLCRVRQYEGDPHLQSYDPQVQGLLTQYKDALTTATKPRDKK
jgi:hypothetical protein